MELLIQRLKSKTYQAALLGALLTILDANSGLISQFVPPEYRAWLVAGWPLAMMIMREVTKVPLSEK